MTIPFLALDLLVAHHPILAALIGLPCVAWSCAAEPFKTLRCFSAKAQPMRRTFTYISGDRKLQSTQEPVFPPKE
jgi:hypothetical protein